MTRPPAEKHALVGDWNADDLEMEIEQLGRVGITLNSSGIVSIDKVSERRAKLEKAIKSTPRIDALMFCIVPVDAQIIGLLPETCRLLQRNGTGLDNVDLEAAAERGMTVRNTPRYCVEEVAVHAMGMLMALHRQMPATQARLLDGGWGGKTPRPTHRFSTQRLGVLGFGRIGRKLAELMWPLVRDVVYYDEVAADGIDWAARVTAEELLRAADLISVHLPLTPETRGIINHDTIATMKESAVLVNAARGGLVDSEAMAAALNEGRIGGAGIDVFEPEIPPDDSPLRSAPNILLTGHTAWYSEESIQDSRAEAVESVIQFLGDQQ